MSIDVFDLADELQTPVFFMTDLDIGMNDWMCPDLTWDTKYKPKRGKVLSAKQLEKMENFYRYYDHDGDGIPYRSLPGTHPKGSFFTRGSGHNKFGGYTEDGEEYKEVVDRLLVKWETARKICPKPEIKYSKNNKEAIIAFGSSDGACKEALKYLNKKDMNFNYCRIKSFPFNKSIERFINKHEKIYIVEQNRDAQMKSLLMLDLNIDPVKLESILHYNGNPINAKCIIDGLKNE